MVMKTLKQGKPVPQNVSMFMIALVIAVFFALLIPSKVFAASRIKDITSVEGVRENQLVGYGLVVGLNGTGDTFQNVPHTEQSLVAMLERFGTNINGEQLRPENVATVIVTADLPAFARPGTRIDVSVSSIGDAEDLRGGTLVVTPLQGANGEVYAVAQGTVAVAGFNVQGQAAQVVQGVPTSGRISNGAIIENEVNFELANLSSVRLSLHNPDFTTAKRVATAINKHLGSSLAIALDPSTIKINRPVGYRLPLFNMLQEIEQLEVEPDQRARVLIDERTGIIVMGSEVRINPVAIAQGNLVINIQESPQVSQPNAFGEGETVAVPQTEINVEEVGTELRVLPEAVTLRELVDGLNALGVSPRDMISILQAIKASGAMQAEIEVI
jgi:flagellar P-ring protein precursor FlgI